MKKTTLALATAASLVLFSGPLLAAGGSSGSDNSQAGNTSGSSWTDDNSGSMGSTGSMDSTGTMAGSQSFDQLDQDGDGQLSESELSAYGSTAAGQSTTGSEPSDRGERLMEQLDEDRSGYVDKEELQQSHSPAHRGTQGDTPAAGQGTGTSTY